MTAIHKTMSPERAALAYLERHGGRRLSAEHYDILLGQLALFAPASAGPRPYDQAVAIITNVLDDYEANYKPF